MIAEGIFALASLFRTRQGAAALVLAIAVCVLPAKSAGEHLLSARQREEMKPALRHLAREWRSGDALYVFYRAQYALRYYLDCNCFEPLRSGHELLAIGRARHPGPAQYAPALRSHPRGVVVAERERSVRRYLERTGPLREQKRVWVLVTAADPTERAVLDYLSCVGRRRESFVEDDGERPFHSAAVYRYDLSGWRTLADGAACEPQS